MKVELTQLNAQEALDKLYTACRTCYNAGTPNDMYQQLEQIESADKVKLIHQVIRSGHHSVLEHQTLTFLISGVSRALSHQFVRHRLASYSQQSQRYCEFADGVFDYVIPDKIKNNAEALQVFEAAMKRDSEDYKRLVDLGMPAEDARMVLPNACCTNLVCTMNLREFIHFCHERMCSCAQSEIRHMANQMAKKAGEALPFMAEFFVPKCEMFGYCNEPARRSCGRKKLLKDALK